jgi:hypothetical protein
MSSKSLSVEPVAVDEQAVRLHKKTILYVRQRAVYKKIKTGARVKQWHNASIKHCLRRK